MNGRRRRRCWWLRRRLFRMCKWRVLQHVIFLITWFPYDKKKWMEMRKKRCCLCSLLVTLIISCCIVMSAHSWMMPQCNLCMNEVFLCLCVAIQRTYSVFPCDDDTLLNSFGESTSRKWKGFFTLFKFSSGSCQSFCSCCATTVNMHTHTHSFTLDSQQKFMHIVSCDLIIKSCDCMHVRTDWNPFQWIASEAEEKNQKNRTVFLPCKELEDAAEACCNEYKCSM